MGILVLSAQAVTIFFVYAIYQIKDGHLAFLVSLQAKVRLPELLINISWNDIEQSMVSAERELIELSSTDVLRRKS